MKPTFGSKKRERQQIVAMALSCFGFVLAVADRREVRVRGARQQVTVGEVADPDEVVVDVAKVVTLVELKAGRLSYLVSVR